jgi:serine protease AprX
VEQAWKAGIVVVAAAGNAGSYKLSNPANDPMILTVGASSTKGTISTYDDRVASFTNNPVYGRDLDVVAPGESIVSLRVPGSNIDAAFASARVGTTQFKGTGTSQSAAVVSGAIALLLQARPGLTPDLVKEILKDTGTTISGSVPQIDVNRALAASTLRYTQTTKIYATGLGTLQEARGTSAVVSDGVALKGERSIFGPFDSSAWAAKSKARTSWTNGLWMGHRAAGDGWTGISWASRTWAGATWTGQTWAGAAVWTDPSWSGRFWANGSWSGGTWNARFWANDDWSASAWR